MRVNDSRVSHMLISENRKGSEAVVDLCHMYGGHHSLQANIGVDGLVGVKGEYE